MSLEQGILRRHTPDPDGFPLPERRETTLEAAIRFAGIRKQLPGTSWNLEPDERGEVKAGHFNGFSPSNAGPSGILPSESIAEPSATRAARI